MKQMLRITGMLLIAFITTLSLTAQAKGKKKKETKSAKTGKVVLFNGKDLENWTFFLSDKSADPEKVFTVKDGVIHITGDPFGYMRTKETYSDYTLHVEYRWPLEASNSGIFIHASTPDTIWLKCFECQLKAGNAGDFVCMNGTDMNERTDKKNRVVPKKGASAEKAVTEWNTVEITCKGATIDVNVNGTLLNKATGANATSGSICLQSEGKAIEFRNIYLTKLKK